MFHMAQMGGLAIALVVAVFNMEKSGGPSIHRRE